MEGNKYTIEEIEFIYGSECDCNAQVTRPVEFIEEAEEIEPVASPTQTIIKNEPMSAMYSDDYGKAMRVIYKQNAATNWLLVAILFMLFMFMIFKCD